MQKTKGFTGDKEFLSNFYKHPFYVPMLRTEVKTVEHGFQAMKTLSKKEREHILSSENAGIAKKRGKKATLREDWDTGLRLTVMRILITDKFKEPLLAKKLLATGQEELVELNHWHDNYFGVCTCKDCNNTGKNMLGELLMAKRTQLRLFQQFSITPKKSH